jgi:hypothetical protein
MSPRAASAGPLITVGCSPPIESVLSHDRAHGSTYERLEFILLILQGIIHEFLQSQGHAISVPGSPIVEVEIQYSAIPLPL